ncbi:hypothetical protein BHE74_00048832 [Ensete ventricosum]|nr:hypothetical protein GW17_00046701 [Ensete ventricosum]RWW45334.1 hypothetical protein BHE74_00048832 [Ensete ventricosum]RZS22367.1 hypothetical protein BHM03_00055134 [Ensete ventricosum]
MYVHKPKDTDKHEHFIKHLVYILTVTARIKQSHMDLEAMGATRLTGMIHTVMLVIDALQANHVSDDTYNTLQ